MGSLGKEKVSSNEKTKIKKLAKLTQDLYQGDSFNITRLTTLKSLCNCHELSIKFVHYLAVCTANRMKEETPSHIEKEKWEQHKKLVNKATLQIKIYIENNNSINVELLRSLLNQLIQLQNKYKKQKWGAVRIIESSDTLLVEEAIKCVLSPRDFQIGAYHVGRCYAEKYNPRYGTGLIPESAPFMEDIVQFWIDYYDLDNMLIM